MFARNTCLSCRTENLACTTNRLNLDLATWDERVVAVYSLRLCMVVPRNGDAVGGLRHRAPPPSLHVGPDLG
jgi:hypothetical protein